MNTPSLELVQCLDAKVLAEAEAYTDEQLNGACEDCLAQAKAYTDTKSAQTLVSANTYTDTKTAQAINTANAYTDTKIAECCDKVFEDEYGIINFKDLVNGEYMFGSYIQIVNNTGSASELGQVVQLDGTVPFEGSGAFIAYNKATTDSQRPIGIVAEAGKADGEFTKILINGIADCQIQSSSIESLTLTNDNAIVGCFGNAVGCAFPVDKTAPTTVAEMNSMIGNMIGGGTWGTVKQVIQIYLRGL